MGRSDTIVVDNDRVKVSAWRGSTTTASLIPISGEPISPDTLEHVLGELANRGYREVITSALAPAERQPFDQRGFTVRDELHLLRLNLDRWPPNLLETTSSNRRQLRAGRRGDMPQVIEVDRHAFDSFWQFDNSALRDAISATPSTRFQVIRSKPITGYHITGRTGTTGYLQRLAVHSDHQGRGLGRALLSDALRWLERQHVRDVYVNTQLSNSGALGLYERVGFRLENRRLAVLQYTLRDTQAPESTHPLDNSRS